MASKMVQKWPQTLVFYEVSGFRPRKSFVCYEVSGSGAFKNLVFYEVSASDFLKTSCFTRFSLQNDPKSAPRGGPDEGSGRGLRPKKFPRGPKSPEPRILRGKSALQDRMLQIRRKSQEPGTPCFTRKNLRLRVNGKRVSLEELWKKAEV